MINTVLWAEYTSITIDLLLIKIQFCTLRIILMCGSFFPACNANVEIALAICWYIVSENINWLLLHEYSNKVFIHNLIRHAIDDLTTSSIWHFRYTYFISHTLYTCLLSLHPLQAQSPAFASVHHTLAPHTDPRPFTSSPSHAHIPISRITHNDFSGVRWHDCTSYN